MSQVFVSDDNTVVYFNIRGGKDIEKMNIDDTKEVVDKVQTQSPLARQRTKALKTSAFFFCPSGDFALLVVGIVKAE